VRCEAISNNFLTGPDRLTRSTVAALTDLGWNAPTKEVPNFWKTYRAGTAQTTLARLARRTMNDVFGISDTASLYIDCGVCITATTTLPSQCVSEAIPELEVGEHVVNLTARRSYRIEELLGKGGFGATYRVVQAGDSPSVSDELCLKIAIEPEAWHREAYFGQLLYGVPRAIAVYDSFATLHEVPGRGSLPLYCLVTELARHGDLVTYMKKRQAPWTEVRACREVAAILRVLVRLHTAAAVHRDLTPSNVLVTDGEHLKLGDFGIARHSLGSRPISADLFNPWFAPPSIAEGDTSSWRPADDVYQMGVILAMLLGMPMDTPPSSDAVKCVRCTAPVKAIIQRAIGERRRRYEEAGAMLAALDARHQSTPRRVRIPSSLKGKIVVFTGALSALSRSEATPMVERRSGRVQPKVTSRTDIVVKGWSPVWKADAKGQKLINVDWEAERGHMICVIDESDFLALVR
jgi:serine/threonine-protein kinase